MKEGSDGQWDSCELWWWWWWVPEINAYTNKLFSFVSNIIVRSIDSGFSVVLCAGEHSYLGQINWYVCYKLWGTQLCFLLIEIYFLSITLAFDMSGDIVIFGGLPIAFGAKFPRRMLLPNLLGIPRQIFTMSTLNHYPAYRRLLLDPGLPQVSPQSAVLCHLQCPSTFTRSSIHLVEDCSTLYQR